MTRPGALAEHGRPTGASDIRIAMHSVGISMSTTELRVPLNAERPRQVR